MSDNTTLRLPEEISIENVNELKLTLLEVLHNYSSVCINGAELLRIDTAGIQLLTVFVIEMVSADKQLKWDSPSPALITTARQLGLDQKLLLESATWQES